MVLRLVRRSVGINHDNYFVFSGEQEIGHIWLAHGYDIWHWQIKGFYIEPFRVGHDSGVAKTREGAMKDFAARLRAGFAFAGLREYDPSIDADVEDPPAEPKG